MVCRPVSFSLIVLLVSTSPALTAVAQSTLPDISCIVENGAVSISWNSQYAGLKAINVLRSADSVYDFATVGTVKKPVKGGQSYVDASPLVGRNFYKLSIVFGSGVTWASNLCKCTVSGGATSGTISPVPVSRDSAVRERNGVSPKKEVPMESKGAIDESMSDRLPKKKIVVAFDDPTEQPNTFIKSQYLSTDAVTGHIKMDLPDDVATNHYSIKFYDGRQQLVTEVPHINHAHIIFDKRNFPGKGMYKFVLRRDIVELESGYINVR